MDALDWERCTDLASAEERHRLAMAYLGPFMKALMAQTRIHRLDIEAASRGETWTQHLVDSDGGDLMASRNAWDAVVGLCGAHGVGGLLQALLADFPEAQRILHVGYVRAYNGMCGDLKLEIFLPWNGTYVNWETTMEASHGHRA